MITDQPFWQIIDEARRDRRTSDERLQSIRTQLMGKDAATLATYGQPPTP